jgi:hypothetical protein
MLDELQLIDYIHTTPGRFENSAKKSQLAFTFILQYAGAKLFENVTFAVTERDA